jgi:hypothetical protein
VDALAEALQRLDAMERPVTDWEAAFLESGLRRLQAGQPFTAKQRLVVARMTEAYLEDAALAAEVCGQQRLL